LLVYFLLLDALIIAGCGPLNLVASTLFEAEGACILLLTDRNEVNIVAALIERDNPVLTNLLVAFNKVFIGSVCSIFVVDGVDVDEDDTLIRCGDLAPSDRLIGVSLVLVFVVVVEEELAEEEDDELLIMMLSLLLALLVPIGWTGRVCL
jgi:hypothetical protein